MQDLISKRSGSSGLWLPPAAAKVDSAEGHAAMISFRKHRSIAAPDDHALVEADQRFQTAIAQAIAVGGERVEAVEATVDLKRRTPLDTKSAPLVWVDNVATGNGGVRYRIWQGRQSLTRDGRHTREIWMVWRQTASGSRRRCIGAVDTLEQARALAKSDHAGRRGR